MNATTPQLGQPLVVYVNTSVCDGPHQHDVTLITDGRTAYTYGDDAEAGEVTRDGTTLTATCRQAGARPVPGYDDEPDPCDGQVSWDLSQPNTWLAKPDAINSLVGYGHKIDAVTPEWLPDLGLELDLSEAADYVMAVTSDPHLSMSMQSAALAVWRLLTGASSDAQAIAYAAEVAKMAGPVRAHVTPF